MPLSKKYLKGKVTNKNYYMNYKTFFSSLVFASLFFVLTNNSIAQTPNSSYIIKKGDWLRNISQRAYGNPSLYTQIIEGTNERHLLDKSFQKITNVNSLRIGQKIWIPAQTTSSKQTNVADTFELVSVPKTNCEIRIWYNYQVVAISKLNENWIRHGISLKERAIKAYELRHSARVNARFMMADKAEVKKIQERDQQKYGNPDGPTFNYLVKKTTAKGLSIEEAYQKIIESSSRVSKVYNSDCA